MKKQEKPHNTKRNLTTLTRGTLIIKNLAMPQYDDGRKRNIRIWLPDGYEEENPTKRYPVLYMHDGQNLFDKYTSFVGEWEIDESIGAMMDQGYPGTIVVGIDNSEDRLNEYSPNWPRQGEGIERIQNPSGEKYARFVVETVKPYVDAHFHTNPDRTATGIGGSSMGGVISYYLAMTYPETFGYALLFSTAMWIYEDHVIETFLKQINIKTMKHYPRLYLYAGGREPRTTPFVEIIKQTLFKRKYPETHIGTLIDPECEHNEIAWAKYFPIAYRWLNNIQ